MGKNPNTFQKRQREFEKKRKAEDKRKRRIAQKNAPPVQNVVDNAGEDHTQTTTIE
jgi:hypothetical protein